MNFAKFRIIAGACGYLLLAFSVSANAQGIDPLDSGISIESWLFENGQEVPVLSFDSTFDQGDLADDIRVENIIEDKDGSIRFQLSHRGPLSRQVFANVHSAAQEGGFTKTIITNIADGDQTEYLSRTAELAAFIKQDRNSDSSLKVRSEKTGDQDTECVICAVFIAVGIACVRAESRAFQECRQNCQDQGGIRYFDAGTCGSVSSECTCWTQPREIAIDF